MLEARSFCPLVESQMHAGLWMLRDILRACPGPLWDTPVAAYPVWAVAYHTLCYVDVYAAAEDGAWKPDLGSPGRGGMHPLGRAELENEHPSRRFERDEVLAYLDRVRGIVSAALAAETDASLAGPSGFPRLRFTRAEVYLYNLRHLQHHTGQLSAHLRRAGVDTRWRGAGWPEGV